MHPADQAKWGDRFFIASMFHTVLYSVLVYYYFKTAYVLKWSWVLEHQDGFVWVFYLLTLIDIVVQVFSVALRGQSPGWHAFVDLVTSTAPMVVTGIVYFSDMTFDAAGWKIFTALFIAAIVEVSLLWLVMKMIAAARTEQRAQSGP